MDFEMRLDYQDSNLDKQNQNLLCYHYTKARITRKCTDSNENLPVQSA